MSWIVLDAAAGALFKNGIDSPLSSPVRCFYQFKGDDPVCIEQIVEETM